MLKIGITGGIGSGKSTVCKIFELLGVKVYYADNRAKWLMHHDEFVVRRIKEEFGSDIYDEKGLLKREELARQVFEDKKQLNLLNSIVHPAVFQDADLWMKEHVNEPYVIKEAALLIESGSYKSLDVLVVVVAPEQLRIERVSKRDGSSEAQVRSRIANQTSDEEKMALADHIIFNDARHLLIPQVMQLHQIFLAQDKKPGPVEVKNNQNEK